jgi:iron(III) transport system substrate-binding protein
MPASMGTITGDRQRLARRMLVTGLAAASLGWPAARAAVRAVRVLSTTDRPVVQPLLDDFERRHPAWRVDYQQVGSAELARRFAASGGRGADVLWSSAMDLQIKAVNDGLAAHYESPHARHLPRWAVWKNEAYATTYEPAGLAYHRGLWADAAVPRSHAELAELLATQAPRLRQRVATYDVERAGLGYLLATQDGMASRRAWALVEALATCQAHLHADTQGMLESVAAGEALIAYNVLGTYAEAYGRSRPEIAIVYPTDYTLVASRVACIARHAPHFEGACRWLDHLLSADGQRILADTCGLYPVREDAATARSGAALRERLGAAARPIALGPGLLAHLDTSRREAFLRRWRKAFAERR